MQSLYLEDWKRCWSEIYRIKDKSGLEQTTIKIRSHGLRNSNTSRHDQGSNSNSPTSLPVPAWNWGLWIFYFQLRYYMYYTISMLEPSPNTRITGPWAVRFNIHVLHFLLKNMYLFILCSFSHKKIVILNLLMLKLRWTAFPLCFRQWKCQFHQENQKEIQCTTKLYE